MIVSIFPEVYPGEANTNLILPLPPPPPQALQDQQKLFARPGSLLNYH